MKYQESEKGQVLVLAVIVLGLILANSLILVAKSITFFQNSKYSTFVTEANALAEAGIDKAIASLNASGGSYLGDSKTLLGNGYFTVTVTSQDGSTKQIEATGYSGKEGNEVKRTIKVVAGKGLGVSFKYGIQVGDGGIDLSEGSEVNGSIYSNGNIIMGNNTRINGDAYVAGGVAPLADQVNECLDPNCGDYLFGKNITGEERLSVAQSFKTDSADYLRKVGIKIKKIGSPADLVVRVLEDNGGMPDKNHVLSTSTFTANLITENYSFVEIALSSPPLLSTETTYWLLVTAGSNNNNYYSWSEDLGFSYSEGQARWSSNWQAKSPVWGNVNGDLDFKTYLGGISTYINGSNGARISGDAHANTLRHLNISGSAYYQVKEDITAQVYFPNSSDPGSVIDPVSEGNISAWKEKAETAGVYSGDINSCPATLGPGKYSGNISLSNGCIVTITDPIWITGNLTLSNGANLKLDPGYGVSSGVILVDGQTSLANNIKIKGSGVEGSYLMLLSLYDSRLNNQIAIQLSNSGNEGVLSAPFGIISVANNNHVSEINAWKISLGNGVIVDYDEGFSSLNFSSGPTGAYSLIKGTYQIK